MKNNKPIADYITVEEAISLAKHLVFTDSVLATKIYKSVMTETAENIYSAAGAVFQAGYIAGIRAEREKRRIRAMKQNEMTNATLSMVEKAASRHDRAFFKVSGVCMEGVGIHDGDYVLVDFRKMPRPPRKGAGTERDICLCADDGPDYVGVKEYLGRWGGFHVVGDHPVRKEGDLLIAAGHLVNQIWGVVSACYSADWQLRWERDISDCPADLPTVSTIHGDNCGEPESAGERVEAAP